MSESAIRELLPPLQVYLDLLLRWNQRVNLTAIRDPAEIVTRHFGESLYAGLRLPANGSLLDLGSGAGFPGLPIQLLRPELRVTLAESQGKKVAFLREAVRALALPTAIWPRRAETFPEGTSFDTVTLRAVDGMAEVLKTGVKLALTTVCVLTSAEEQVVGCAKEFIFTSELLPLSSQRKLLIGTRKV